MCKRNCRGEEFSCEKFYKYFLRGLEKFSKERLNDQLSLLLPSVIKILLIKILFLFCITWPL